MKNIFFHFPQKIGRIEEERQKNSEDLAKTLEKLEEWKKLWKKAIIPSYKKYFLSFSTEDWKNGRREAEKFRRPGKTLEELEEWKKLWKKK